MPHGQHAGAEPDTWRSTRRPAERGERFDAGHLGDPERVAYPRRSARLARSTTEAVPERINGAAVTPSGLPPADPEDGKINPFTQALLQLPQPLCSPVKSFASSWTVTSLR
jgi:hypothetical protein